MTDSLTHRPLSVLRGPQSDPYEDESPLCLWGWTVPTDHMPSG